MVALLVLAGDASGGEPADEEENGEIDLPEMVVTAERPLTSGSDVEFRSKDFLHLPRQTPSDLLRIVPGIHISQHTGGAKAHQIFLRGFDCEHGQDFAGYLDGIPLNQVSQVHGEGYLDLHFLIPETVERIDVMRGSYDAQYGNCAVAGLMNIRPAYDLADSDVKLQGGSFDALRGVVRISLGEGHTFAFEADRTDGFTVPGEASGKRFFTSHVFGAGDGGRTKVIYTHFDSEYGAADVVPVDLITYGMIDRFSGMDSSDGGETDMDILGIRWENVSADRDTSVLFYTSLVHTDIYSNYTYYLFDQVRGDQMELYDRRACMGFRFQGNAFHTIRGREARSTWGLDLRGDDVHQIQARTEQRVRFNTLSDYEFTQGCLAGYLKTDVRLRDDLRLVPGIRLDVLRYDVEGTQDIEYFDVFTNKVEVLEDAPIEKEESYAVLSPKVSLILDLHRDPEGAFSGAQLFGNYGQGFTSLKASVVANSDIDYVPQSRAGELSSRFNFYQDRLSLSPGVWIAHKEVEMVFEPETGVSVPRGASLRYGFELELRYQPRPSTYLYLDYFETSAEFTADDSDIPGTPERMVVLGGSYEREAGFRCSFRTRFMAPRPLGQGVDSSRYAVTDASIGYRRNAWELELSVENLFDTEWDDTSFYYESRPSPAAAAYEQVHITPGTPRAMRASLTWRF